MMLPFLILAALGSSAQDDTGPTTFRFRVEVRTVYVDAFVKRGGEPVTGLTADDFEILDNGVPQQIALLNPGALPLSTMLLLDISGSVVGEKLDHLRNAAHAFVERLQAKDEVGLLTFTRDLRLRASLGPDVAALHRALEQPMVTGETSLYDAIYTGAKLVEGRGGRPLIVLFTDGLDNTSWLTESEVLETLKASEAVIYAVGFRPEKNNAIRNSGRFMARHAELGAVDFLQSIARVTGGRVWYIDSGANLKEAFLSILAEMESRYLLAYEPQGVLSQGWHSLEVRVRGGKADEIRARPGYSVGPNP